MALGDASSLLMSRSFGRFCSTSKIQAPPVKDSVVGLSLCMEPSSLLERYVAAAARRKRQSSALAHEHRSAGLVGADQRPLGQLQLRILKDAGSHLRHRVEQAARLQRLAVLRL
jgi:hypothetical protein